ncbi:glycosyltransferase family 9 protein [Croceitalea marina]|uniref:Glycosyltransferase family 9 protein n=1 Tax=Croceitalea marina TaxID=1775166 RepID=A0ABW5MXW4_9FLAO
MDKNKTYHLLIIRLSAMGDIAMTVPVLLHLTNTYPELKITVLTKDFFKPIFSEIPNISIYGADVKEKHKGIFGLWKLYRELKLLHIDAVADLHNVLRSNILKFFFWFSGTPFQKIDKGRKEKKVLTSGEPNFFRPLKTTHQRYAEVFKSLNFPIRLQENFTLPKQEIAVRLPDLSCPKTQKWIGIAPFAAFSGKTYPYKLMQEVVDKLNASGNYQILLFGGGNHEKQLLEAWEEKFVNCVSVVGKMSFTQELSIISNLNIMLSMDSGNAHLAANYGVPVVTLWGVTHPYAGFAPFGQPADNALLADREKFPLIPTSIYGNKVPDGYKDVMKTILADDVVQKVIEVIH